MWKDEKSSPKNQLKDLLERCVLRIRKKARQEVTTVLLGMLFHNLGPLTLIFLPDDCNLCLQETAFFDLAEVSVSLKQVSMEHVTTDLMSKD